MLELLINLDVRKRKEFYGFILVKRLTRGYHSSKLTTKQDLYNTCIVSQLSQNKYCKNQQLWGRRWELIAFMIWVTFELQYFLLAGYVKKKRRFHIIDIDLIFIGMFEKSHVITVHTAPEPMHFASLTRWGCRCPTLEYRGSLINEADMLHAYCRGRHIT